MAYVYQQVSAGHKPALCEVTDRPGLPSGLLRYAIAVDMCIDICTDMCIDI